MYQPGSLLITGGCGFIGSEFVNQVCERYSNIPIICVDRLDYCARIENWHDHVNDNPNFKFIRGDISSRDLIAHILDEYDIDTVVHFAAQTHVDNSFGNSIEFTKTNVLGTHVLLECCRQWGKIQRFVHMSTDEVYGEIHLDCKEGYCEKQLLDPTNPYAATKAAAEHMVKSYKHSYKLPIQIIRANNNYGPGQHCEKLIPRFTTLLLNGCKVTIHGEGISRRNFIHVSDTCRAIIIILEKGELYETYNIGTDNEFSVMDIADLLRTIICPVKPLKDILEYVSDRNFNDIRYHLNSDKIRALGWSEEVSFHQGLKDTIEWYVDRLDEFTQKLNDHH